MGTVYHSGMLLRMPFDLFDPYDLSTRTGTICKFCYISKISSTFVQKSFLTAQTIAILFGYYKILNVGDASLTDWYMFKIYTMQSIR